MDRNQSGWNVTAFDRPTADRYTRSSPDEVRVYEQLAARIDELDEQRAPLYLTKLVLLLANEVGEADTVRRLVEEAALDL